MEKLISPKEAKEQIPINKETLEQVYNHQKQIRKIMNKEDPRKIIIAGPCSMDFEEQILEYWKKLKKIHDNLNNKFFIIMRAYDSKPRTTVGWKWIIQGWEYWSPVDINKWILTSRKIISKLTNIWLPVANEILYPYMLPYLDDLLSFVAIGARSWEDQSHRELASATEIPTWIKNPTSWDTIVTANNLIAARSKQPVFIPWLSGFSRGNPNSCTILRWKNFEKESIQNIDDEFISKVDQNLDNKWLSTQYIIDLNHDNSGKNADLQEENLEKSVNLKNWDKIIGFMFESYLKDGNQTTPENQSHLAEKWKSLTDPCIWINKLQKILENLYKKI